VITDDRGTASRAPYHTPELEDLGELAELTAGGSSYNHVDSGYGTTTGNPLGAS
jgi:hypothetical protein